MGYRETVDALDPGRKRAIFIISTTSQARLVGSIVDSLDDWESIIINENFHGNQVEIERLLADMGMNWFTVESVRKGWVRRIIDKIAPNVVAVCNDRSPMSSIFIKAAKRKGIGTLLIQDGLLTLPEMSRPEGPKAGLKLSTTLARRFRRSAEQGGYLREQLATLYLFIANGFRSGGEYGLGECDSIAVFGADTKVFLVKKGVSDSRIFITGSPKFDELVVHGSEGSVDERHTRRVLLMTQSFVEHQLWTRPQWEDFVTTVITALNGIENIALTIKVHPGEDIDPYDNLLSSVDPHYEWEIIKEGALSEQLRRCDTSITVNSTAGLEAMSQGKPLVIIDLFSNGGIEFYEHSGAWTVSSKDDIAVNIENSLDPARSDEYRRRSAEFLERHIYKRDGRAAERITDLIERMADRPFGQG